MGRGSAVRHQEFKDRAKSRVDDLQEMFSGLQSARQESRAADAAVIEEQLNLTLREWRAELSAPSPASSLAGNQLDSSDPPSRDLQLLQLRDEEDDATSKLVEEPPAQVNINLKQEEVVSHINASEPNVGDINAEVEKVAAGFDEKYFEHQELTIDDIIYDDEFKINFHTGPIPDPHDHLQIVSDLEYNEQFDNFVQEAPEHEYFNFENYENDGGGGAFCHMSDLLSTISPPPSAFLRPKCALWDCPRPAQGTERCQDYCCIIHVNLALKEEGLPGTAPVIRPGGIELKDGPLFSALSAKILGKKVGIPVCEGAATSKSPWNAPELFDLCVLAGESVREWLFFDKPRRAFESGNRKQRSLPDYNGRGWHESRKQMMKEFGGLKRSYYMDPQPLTDFEWHLYEYEISDYDAFALYRLEFKSVDAKRSVKSKMAGSSVADLQQQMGKLSADSPTEPRRNARSRAKPPPKDAGKNARTGTQNAIPSAYPMPMHVGMDQLAFSNMSAGSQYKYTTEGSKFYWNPSEHC